MIVVGELKYLQYIENKICTIIVLAFFLSLFVIIIMENDIIQKKELQIEVHCPNRKLTINVYYFIIDYNIYRL